jgi:hypothetical protein
MGELMNLEIIIIIIIIIVIVLRKAMIEYS